MSSKKSIKVLVTCKDAPRTAINILKKRGIELIFCDSLPPKRQEILKKCRGVNGILWATRDEIDAEVIKAAGKQLKVIAVLTKDLDYVDMEALREHQIQLGFAGAVADNAIAELAIGLTIIAARRFTEGVLKLKAGDWQHWNSNFLVGGDIHGATIGFVEFGSVGDAIASRLRPFGIHKFMHCSSEEDPFADKSHVDYVSFETICEESDIIYITCPLSRHNKHLFHKKAFEYMKQNCILVNVSKPGIINEVDLYEALTTGKINAAAADLMDYEALPRYMKLTSLPNFFMTPCLGHSSVRTVEATAKLAARNLIHGVDGLPILSPAFSVGHEAQAA